MIKPLDEFSGLIKLGLSETQAKTYLTLLRIGEASVNKIAKESGIHPRSTYDALDGLLNKGLITFSEKNGVRVFYANNLDSLMDLVDEKKNVVEQLLPILENQLKKHDTPLVRVFTGVDGMRTIWEDALKQKDTIYFYGGAMQGFRFYMRDYAQRWNKKREKLGIPVKGIFVDQPGVFASFKNFSLWSARALPEKQYSSVAWWLHANKMVLIFWSPNPLGIMIESPDVAKTYRNFFNIVWNVAGKKKF